MRISTPPEVQFGISRAQREQLKVPSRDSLADLSSRDLAIMLVRLRQPEVFEKQYCQSTVYPSLIKGPDAEDRVKEALIGHLRNENYFGCVVILKPIYRALLAAYPSKEPIPEPLFQAFLLARNQLSEQDQVTLLKKDPEPWLFFKSYIKKLWREDLPQLLRKKLHIGRSDSAEKSKT